MFKIIETETIFCWFCCKETQSKKSKVLSVYFYIFSLEFFSNKNCQ